MALTRIRKSNRHDDVTTDIETLISEQSLDSADFDAILAEKTTDDLSEGSNLYYTTARFDSDFSTGGTFTSNITFSDNVKAIFGDSSDLQIYHSGSHSFIDDAGQGNLYVRANNLTLGKYTGEAYITTQADGNVVLYYDNSSKLTTTATGVDVTGTANVDALTTSGVAVTASGVHLDDNKKLVFGTDSDVTIEYDPNSFRINAGSWNAQYQAGNHYFRNNTGSVNAMIIDPIGAITMKYNNSTKLQTASTGIDVTGEITADSATIPIMSGDITFTGNLQGPSTWYIDPAPVDSDAGLLVIRGDLQVDGTTTTVNSTTVTINDKNIVLADSAANASEADGAGITVEGANATITYDATNDEWDFNKDINVTGTLTTSSSITSGNDVYVADSRHLRWPAQSSNSTAKILFGDTAGTGGTLDFRRNADGAQLLTILGSGNVGIGTNNPAKPLTIQNNTPVIRGIDNNLATRYFDIGGENGNVTIDIDPGQAESTSYFNVKIDNTEQFRITKDGSVGIGTTNPWHLLHLRSNGDAGIHIQADADNSGEHDNAYISMSQDGGTATGMKLGLVGNAGAEFDNSIANAAFVHANNASSQPLQFAHDSAAVMTLQNGKVGIGTTSPRNSSTLDVEGSIRAGISGNADSNVAALLVNSAGTSSTQAAIAIQQTRTEGDTIIFADYEPYVEYGINTDNSADTIEFTGGGSSGNFGSKTLYNRSGDSRTAYIKHRIDLNTGDVRTGGIHRVEGYIQANKIVDNGSANGLTIGDYNINDSDQWPQVSWLRDTPNNWDEGLIKASSSRGVFGVPHFGIHFHQNRSFAFHTSGWDTEMEIKGDGKIYMKGPVGIGTASPESTLHIYGQTQDIGYPLPNAGSAAWNKVGRIEGLTQGGNEIHISFTLHSGYNASNAQDYSVELFMKTSNNNSVNSDGASFNTWYYKIGNSGALPQFKWVRISGTDNYDLYMYVPQFSAGSYYKVNKSNGTWKHGIVSATDPGSNSALIQEAVHSLNFWGNVGIGTGSPDGLQTWKNGTRTLDLKLETTPASGDVGVQFRANTGAYLGLAAGGGSDVGIVIDSTNKVGIGTASPAQELHVNGSTLIGNTLFSSGITDGSVGSFDYQLALGGSHNVAPNTGDYIKLLISGVQNDATGTYYTYFEDENDDHVFSVRQARTGTSGAVDVFVDGRVGIGVTNPDGLLQLQSDGVNDSGRMRIKTTGSTGYSEIQFVNNTPKDYRLGVGGSSTSQYSNSLYIYDNSTNEKVFGINNASVQVGDHNVTRIPNGSGIDKVYYTQFDHTSASKHAMVLAADNNGEAHLMAVDAAQSTGSNSTGSSYGGWGWDMYYHGTSSEFFRMRMGESGTWTEILTASAQDSRTGQSATANKWRFKNIDVTRDADYKSLQWTWLTDPKHWYGAVTTSTTGNFNVATQFGLPSDVKAIYVNYYYHISGYSLGQAGQGDHATAIWGPVSPASTTSWSFTTSGNYNWGSAHFMHDGDASESGDLAYYGQWYDGSIIPVNANGNIYYRLAHGHSGGTHHNHMYVWGYAT